MRAQLALALMLTCGVAMAGGTAIQVSGAPALPLTGGTVSGNMSVTGTLGVTGALTVPSFTTTAASAASGSVTSTCKNTTATGYCELEYRNSSNTQLGTFGIGNPSAAVPYKDALYASTGVAVPFKVLNGGVLEATFNSGTTFANTLTATGAFIASSALNKGSKVLSGGTGTVTVTSGAKCVCGLEVSAGTAAPKCAVSSTTLTITGSGTDTISYVCE